MVILNRQTIEDVRLGQKVKSGDAEAIVAGLVFDSADASEWRKKRFVVVDGVTVVFPDSEASRLFLANHHGA
jgi:hypothetical protein